MTNFSHSALVDFNTLLNNRSQKFRYASPTIPAPANASTKGKSLRVDINDDGESLQLIAEMPGIDKSEIHVSVDESVLTIESKTARAQDARKGTTRIRSERFIGDFKRSFTLGDDIDKDGISAQFDNGLLILTVPKRQEVIQEPTKIDVH
jgi:HSP20 family molecular chaperone IbpA